MLRRGSEEAGNGVDEAVVAYLSDASEQAQDRYAQVRQIVHAQS